MKKSIRIFSNRSGEVKTATMEQYERSAQDLRGRGAEPSFDEILENVQDVCPE